jgi:photosystem II stability/assembly factor-like uncharacterized protein
MLMLIARRPLVLLLLLVSALILPPAGRAPVSQAVTSQVQWTPVGLPDHHVNALAIDPTNTHVVYAATGTGQEPATQRIYKTSNGGQQWPAVYTAPQGDHLAIAINPQNPSVVYVGEAYEVLKTIDAGARWFKLPSIGAAGHTAIVIDPASPNTVYIGMEHGWGIFKSTTGGSSWTNVLTSRYIDALAIDPSNPQIVYAGTRNYNQTPGGVLKSSDGGQSWTRVTTNTRVNALAIDPANPSTLYAALEGEGVLKSTNAGASWASFNAGLTHTVVRALAVAPANPDVIYAGTWEGGVFRSEDGGASWNAINAGLSNTYILSLAVDPANTDTVYAGTEGSGVFKLASSTFSVSGQVRDARNTPLPGVTISDGAGHSSVTDSSGNYTLSGLTPGSYTLTPTRAGYSFAPPIRSVAVPPNKTGQDFSASDGAAATWTIMLYLAGDNDLEIALERAIKALEKLPGSPAITVVALFDGFRPGDTRRLVIQPGGSYTPGIDSWALGELNLGDPQILADFITWSRTNYPATYTYLAVADHGRGLTGVAWDDTSGDYLSNADMRVALAAATGGGQQKIDVLHYDTCLMALLETGYQAKDYANFMVASENLGWSVFAYDSYIQQIGVSTTPRELAGRVATAYFQDPRLQGHPRTISTLDLSRAVALRQALDTLAGKLRANLPALKATIADIRTTTQKFSSRDYYRISNEDEYLDLYDLVDKLARFAPNAEVQQAALAVRDAITAALVAEYHQSGSWNGAETWNLDQAHGVAIYFPPHAAGRDYAGYASHTLVEFTRDSLWDEFLADYFADQPTPLPPPDPGRPPMLAPAYRLHLPLLQR